VTKESNKYKPLKNEKVFAATRTKLCKKKNKKQQKRTKKNPYLFNYTLSLIARDVERTNYTKLTSPSCCGHASA
jgi:hypothetical protein